MRKGAEFQSVFEKTTKAKQEFHKRIVGQEEVFFDLPLVALLSSGMGLNFHILFEGPVGVAKTQAIKVWAKILGLKFQRIQMTPDKLPADILGFETFNPKANRFDIRKGPIFTNLLLVDEINRASGKTQSALLEAMQEGQVTIGETSFMLEQPFLVMATQNSLEQHRDVYPLGAAQLDRFLMKVNVGYPTKEEEKKIVRLHLDSAEELEIEPVFSRDEILAKRKLIQENVYLDPRLQNLIVSLVEATRPDSSPLDWIKRVVETGVSPRSSIYLAVSSRALAVLRGRDFVLPEDVYFLAPFIIPHRIILKPSALETDKQELVERLIKEVER